MKNKETLEQAAENWIKSTSEFLSVKNGFTAGYNLAKEQDKNKYSEEDMINFAKFFTQYTFIDNTSIGDLYALDKTGNYPAYKITELISIFKNE
jgi:hypothetical protein